MKNGCYFTLKSLFFFRYWNFCPDFFGYVENGLIRKLMLISKIVTSQTGKQIIAIHILSNISRSIDNQTTKNGRFIEYNMRSIFFKKWYTECGGETSPRSFSEKLKLSISLDEQSEMLHSLFLLYVQIDDYQKIMHDLDHLLTTCFCLIQSFLRNNDKSGPKFFAWFLKKNISHVIFY